MTDEQRKIYLDTIDLARSVAVYIPAWEDRLAALEACLMDQEAVEGRTCQNCRHWLAYNAGQEAAVKGECLHPDVDDHVRVIVADEYGDESRDADDLDADFGYEISKSLVTPFDWGCAGFERRPIDAGDGAQSCPG